MNSKTVATSSSLDSYLGFWLRFVSNHVSGRFRAMLESEGISVAEWVALRVLADRSEMSHAELIQVLGMTKGAASKVISRLEAKGLASRRLVDGGQREQIVSLSRDGRRIVPKLAGLADANDAHFFAHLSPQRREVLKGFLQDLVTHHQMHESPVE